MKNIIIKTLFIFSFVLQTKEPKNLTLCKQEVVQYYQSGHYQKDVQRAVNKAMRYLQHCKAFKNSVIIFDIDETIFSYYGQAKSIGFGYVPTIFNDWVKQGNFEVIVPVKKLYDYAVSRKFKIVFLSSLFDTLHPYIISNLKTRGFSMYYQCILKSAAEKNMSKSCYKLQHRKALCAQGYDIVATVGDQKSDFFGGCTGYCVKIPNSYYLTV